MADLIKGSGFLAAYIGGLTVGNSRFVHKRSSMEFFDGFSWLAQILMFFTFGMLIELEELLPVAVLGLTIGFFIVIFARPLAVFGCMFPFRKIPIKAKFYVSWVGLRGAVPLIFATCVLAAEIENGRIMFNIVLFIMLVSLLIQGTTVPTAANLLGMGEHLETDNCTEHPEDIKSATIEIIVQKEHLKTGNRLMTIQISEDVLVVMVKRKDRYFIPQGSTKIEEGDILFVISDNEQNNEHNRENLT
jgi:cell volume regulation protein A